MTITRLYRPLTGGHEIYAQIGRVASAWAHFEHELDRAIIDLMGADKRKSLCVLTQILGATPRVQAIILLYQEQEDYDVKFVKDLKKLRETNYNVQDMRNRIVHDPWHFEEVSGEVARSEVTQDRSKAELSIGFRHVSAADIEAVIGDIDKQVMKFRSIYAKICGRHPKILSPHQVWSDHIHYPME